MKYALRSLWRSPGFSTAAVVTLALGVAGATVMFTLVRGVLLRPLPVHDQDSLVVGWKALPTSGFDHYPFGDVEVARVAAESRLFAAVAGVDADAAGRAVLVDGDVTAPVDAALVSGAFFDVLGVRPAAGRLLRPDDDVDGAEPVLVISHRLWIGRFGGQAGVIGRRVTFVDRRFTIVGVLPTGLDFPRGADVVRAFHSVLLSEPFGEAARSYVDLVARLHPGVTREQAVQELQAISARVEAERAATPRPFAARLQPLDEVVVGAARRPLAALLAAVLLLLLVAAINAANLVLLRAERRRGELAVHLALGAGRTAVVGRWLAESLLLAAAATVLGAAIGWAGLGALLALLPPGLPRLDAVQFDGGVAGFLLLAWVGIAILLAAIPALALRHPDPITWLGESGRRTTGGAGRWRRGLVVAQVATAVIVVGGAGLLLRSFADAARLATGLATDRLVFVDLTLAADDRGDRVVRVLDNLATRLGAQPGIAAVTRVNFLPYDANGWDVPAFTVEGQDAATAAANPALNLESIGPRHFTTLGVPLVRGRAFAEADRAGGLAVAILSEDVADRIWPRRDAIGRRIKFGAPDSTEGWLTIVGVAADVRYRELRRPAPTIYVPQAQFIDAAERLAVRTTLSPGAVSAAVRDAVRQDGLRTQVLEVTPFESRRSAALVRPRFDALVAGLFALVAWVIAAVGVHAVIAASVAARTRELAIRTAIGATPRDLRALVVGEAAMLVGLGAAIGIVVGFGAGRSLAAMVEDVRAVDVTTLAAAAALLAGAAALAIVVPMRRAARVDAAATLRG